MFSKKIVMSAWSIIGAAVVGCTLFAGEVAAQGRPVTVTLQVNSRGLDLSQPRGAQQLYWRIQAAAWVVCTHGNRVGLAPSSDPQDCREKALADAIRGANVRLLTRVYLETHTPQEAAARGIEVPVEVAGK
jgi:UrcA family protein